MLMYFGFTHHIRVCQTHYHDTLAECLQTHTKLYLFDYIKFLFDHMIFHLPVTLSTPTVSAQDTSMWSLTSPGGNRVERYIVEFECSVQNVTFVEKYMSVSASRGTARVATNVSCFGGLGQLYRVKVWAVSGPNISRALVCIPDGQCREEGGRHMITCSVSEHSLEVVCMVSMHVLKEKYAVIASMRIILVKDMQARELQMVS